ncbi:MAG: 3-deoxy-manno-octulosonate cytidylyltransferase [Bacteroidales bacterium]|nr:3-deoxy-manno-octulosonate cytidylyltransferase [Bacteroidales bacterium]
MRILGVIPARYASVRFPGKPLVVIQGKTMIRRVYEQVLQAKMISEVVVATDDERIFNEVNSFGGRVVLTNPNHPSGTDRCLEALNINGESYDAVINIQGDEPFIDPGQIDQVADLLNKPHVQIATLAKKITSNDELFNANVVKVIFDSRGHAIYFSRNSLPFLRGVDQSDWLQNFEFYKHIGLYGYQVDTLRKITTIPQSRLEKAESLEQLRWVENGYSIAVGITEKEGFGIDTPEDLKKIANLF